MEYEQIAQTANTLEFLSSGLRNGALNYQITLALVIDRNGAAKRAPAARAARCLNGIAVEAETSASREELMEIVCQALDRRPDTGGGPNERFLASEEFTFMRRSFLRQLGELLDAAGPVTSCSWAGETFGQPLFWSFGYAFNVGEHGLLLIGAAND